MRGASVLHATIARSATHGGDSQHQDLDAVVAEGRPPTKATLGRITLNY